MTDYSQADFNVLVRAIRRFAEEDMDQGAGFRIATSHGDVYVMIGRELPTGSTSNAYPLVDPDE